MNCHYLLFTGAGGEVGGTGRLGMKVGIEKTVLTRLSWKQLYVNPHHFE